MLPGGHSHRRFLLTHTTSHTKFQIVQSSASGPSVLRLLQGVGVFVLRLVFRSGLPGSCALGLGVRYHQICQITAYCSCENPGNKAARTTHTSGNICDSNAAPTPQTGAGGSTAAHTKENNMTLLLLRPQTAGCQSTPPFVEECVFEA